MYFIPKFATIQSPKPTVSHYEERVGRSVVGEFNRVQREQGKQECSNGSSHNWLKADRPKLAICPHQEDYCDTCAKSKETIPRKQTTLNRLRQAAASAPEDLARLEDEIRSCQANLAKQKLSHDVFGLVNHATSSSMVYIFNERVGPKNTDHTLSYVTHYLTKQAELPTWVRRIHIFPRQHSEHQQKSFCHGMGSRDGSVHVRLHPYFIHDCRAYEIFP